MVFVGPARGPLLSRSLVDKTGGISMLLYKFSHAVLLELLSSIYTQSLLPKAK